MTKFRTTAPKSKSGLKILGQLLLLVAMRFGPAGIAAWVIKSVARRPLKMLLVLILEPLIARILRNFSTRTQGPVTK